MMDITNKIQSEISDPVLMKRIGSFIRNHRLEQNKSQSQLAEEAGVNRSTLSQFENGMNSSLLTLIQLLRALNMLHILDVFTIEKQISPLQLARMDKLKRLRAGRREKKENKPESDW
jgi:transcriptional regulator with XRE-family HTH domain